MLFPTFLLAGTGLAAVTLALHLLRRRPPVRQPLPTVRFLEDRSRTLLRFQRVPNDLPLLLVRMAFAIALGATFSGLTWTENRSENGSVILLDAGPHQGSDWDEVRAVAERTATETGASTVVAYGFEGGYRVVDVDALPSLTRGERRATFEDGLRALREATLSTLPHDSVEASWITRPTWTSWTPGFGLLRPALWPGSLQMPSWPSTAAPDPSPLVGPGGPPSAWVVGGDDRSPIVLALGALGFETRSSSTLTESADEGGAMGSDEVPLIFQEAPGANLSRLVEAARRGATVVVGGPLEAQDSVLPWRLAASNGPTGGEGNIVVNSQVTLGRSVDLSPGGPSTQSATILVLEDATPAGAASRVGTGCLVYTAVELSDPVLVAEPQYPSLIARLTEGCPSERLTGGTLDPGARQALVRADLTARIPALALGPPRGKALGRWCALACLVLLLAEVAMTRGERA